MTEISCTLVSVSEETNDIKGFVFDVAEGQCFYWTAGAHVRVTLPAGGDRAYSLLRLPDLGPGQIALGVLREAQSTGGSIYMHGLMVGESVTITAPKNQFPLGDHTTPALLIAGGIGVTPILSMAAELRAQNRPFAVHYAGRHAGALAFVPKMQAICGEALHLHHDNEDSAFDIAAMLRNASEHAHLYICGPSGMIDAVKVEASAQGWSPERIHFELFTAEAPSDVDTAFDVEIHQTGQVIHVPADKTIIEALEGAGLDPLYDCQRGDCGICQCDVIEGIPDHRDVILTDSEKASNSVMQICVSRAKSAKLVLDL